MNILEDWGRERRSLEACALETVHVLMFNPAAQVPSLHLLVFNAGLELKINLAQHFQAFISNKLSLFFRTNFKEKRSSLKELNL